MQDLLFLVHRIPYPPNKGDKIRSYHILKYLSKHHHVHLGTFIDDEKDWEYVEKLKDICGNTCFVKLQPKISRISSLSGVFTGKPLTLTYYHNAGLQNWVNNLLNTRNIKNILVFSSAMAQYVNNPSLTHCIIDFVDVDSDKWNQYSKTKFWPLSWIYRRESRFLLEYEKQTARIFDVSTFVSETESNFFKKLAPEISTKITYFNNGVDAEFFSPANSYDNPYQDNADILIFTGAMDYWANIDAVQWFSHDIFPFIRDQLPSIEFYIVGSRPTTSVKSLSSLPGITVTGSVEDIRPYIAHAALVVVPLRIARGIQNKVLEAMAMEKTVVVSPQAAEGIKVNNGQELFIENNERNFAERIISQIKDGPNLKIGSTARTRILEDYSWEKILTKVDSLLIHEEQESTASKYPDNL